MMDVHNRVDRVRGKEGSTMRRKRWFALALAAAAVSAIALTAGAGASPKAPKRAQLTKVTLQLKWVTQAQFAGYYAAVQQGYYKAAGLAVRIKVGGPSITPETVVVGKQADFGLDWLPNLFATREKGSNLVSIAQVFARSGMTELTWKLSGIDSIAKMRGKKVGVWCCGNQPELFAALHSVLAKHPDVRDEMAAELRRRGLMPEARPIVG